MRRLLPLVLVLAAAVLLAPAAQGFLGEQRLLVIRVTWGPEPFSDAQVQSAVFDQTAAWMKASSFGKTSIAGTQTPWLRVFSAQAPCDMALIERVGREAAQGAGYDLTGYNRVAFLFPRIGCWWTGYGSGETIFLNGALTRTLVAHELGHTYGLSHSNTWECSRGSCDTFEYGDFYDTMGRGDGDFNAWEKLKLGWITTTLAAAGPGLYTIDRPDRPSALPQAFSVSTARTEYWFENRQESLPFLGTVLPTGVLVRTTGPPTTPPQFRTPPTQTLLLPNAAGTGRAALQPGQTFSVPGTFSVTVEAQVDGQAGLRFRWADTTAPAAPKIIAPGARLTRRARFDVRWSEAAETGSGLAAYDVSLDGGKAVRVPVQFPLTPYATFATPRAGAHRVAVRAIDRAGNRGPATVRRFAVTAPH
ncbi:MAG: hypothetical protein ACXWYS_06385 [Gaiellaceae bacterium]